MTGILRAALVGMVCLANLATCCAKASAADYPNRPVRWLIGFAAGGPAIDLLNKAVGEALKDPKLVARLAEAGGLPMPMTPAEFGKLVSDETEKWRKVVEFAGVSVD
jgi:tripartite-type tricarboxylate transporter receptor subunit TctC